MEAVHRLIDAFVKAIHDRDPVQAKRLSTAAGWASRGDSPRRLYRQATTESLVLTRVEPARVVGDRAVARVSLFWRTRGRFVGAPWLLVEREEGEWRVAGVRADRTFSGLFLEGLVPALLSRADLPFSEEGAAWGEAFARSERAGALRSGLTVADVWTLPQLARIPDAAFDDPAYLQAHEGLRRELGVRKVFAVTSGRSGEGKSTLSIALATGYAGDGHRVLLVDLDLRLPRLYQRFADLSSGPGVVDVLDGMELSDAVQPSGLDRLDVLTSGLAPDEPEEVLRSTAMVDALADAQRLYDVVVLDLATAIQFDDPFRAMDAVDGPVAPVVVVELGRTTTSELQRTRARFSEFERTPVGIVLNRAPERDEPLDEDHILEMELVDARELPDVGRVAVGLRATRAHDNEGRTRWYILQRTPDGLEPVDKSSVLTLGALVDGIHTVLHPSEGDEPALILR